MKLGHDDGKQVNQEDDQQDNALEDSGSAGLERQCDD
jgi:hypothetical protein